MAQVLGHNDRIFIDVTEERNFVFQGRGEKFFGPAKEDIGLDADLAQLFDAVLRRLCLHLSRGLDERDQREMDEERVFFSEIVAKLPDSLQKGQAFDIADRAPDLHQDNVDSLVHIEDAFFDLVRNVGYHLDCSPQVFAPALFGYDRVIDLSCGEVAPLGDNSVRETLVVSQVKVGFSAVIGDKDFAVLKRIHGPGVYVDVGIKLLQRHRQTPCLQERSDGSRSQALSERRNNTARHEYEFLSHHLPLEKTRDHLFAVYGYEARVLMIGVSGPLLPVLLQAMLLQTMLLIDHKGHRAGIMCAQR